MKAQVHTEDARRWRYAELRRTGGMGFNRMVEIIEEDPRTRGRVLDIGCGGDTPVFVGKVMHAAAQWDGLDPSEDVLTHPHLTERWHAPLEQAGVPESAYDAAIAWLVIEHVADPPGFMRETIRALKPGGVFYASTPHNRHPFTWLSRGIEVIGLKSAAGQQSEARVNDYPAYYRLNSVPAMVRACRGLPVESITAWLMPALNWAMYFPKPARWVPRLYDRCVQTNFPGGSALIMFRVERSTADAEQARPEQARQQAEHSSATRE